MTLGLLQSLPCCSDRKWDLSQWFYRSATEAEELLLFNKKGINFSVYSWPLNTQVLSDRARLQN